VVVVKICFHIAPDARWHLYNASHTLCTYQETSHRKWLPFMQFNHTVMGAPVNSASNANVITTSSQQLWQTAHMTLNNTQHITNIAQLQHIISKGLDTCCSSVCKTHDKQSAFCTLRQQWIDWHELKLPQHKMLFILVFVEIISRKTPIEGLCERTEYVPQLWNWENHS